MKPEEVDSLLNIVCQDKVLNNINRIAKKYTELHYPKPQWFWRLIGRIVGWIYKAFYPRTLLTRATLEGIARDRKANLKGGYYDFLSVSLDQPSLEEYYYDQRSAFILDGKIDSKYSDKELEQIWDEA